MTRVYRSLIKQAVQLTLISEGVDSPCVISVLITDDKGIKAYNAKHRGIKKATDVLSFPMQDFSCAGWQGMRYPDIDMDTQTVPLGDIVISLNKIKQQANRFKVTPEQETVHMIIHSTLHLLGYDHGLEMEYRENRMMRDMGYL